MLSNRIYIRLHSNARFWAVFRRYLFNKIEYEKTHAVHSTELGESNTLIPTTIFIDTYWRRQFEIHHFFVNHSSNLSRFAETFLCPTNKDSIQKKPFKPIGILMWVKKLCGEKHLDTSFILTNFEQLLF